MFNYNNKANAALRKNETQIFWRKFKIKIVEKHFKKKLFDSYNNQCFKCGVSEKIKQETNAPPRLCIDHHIPFALNGHFEAGNLVILCRTCNETKRDKHPADFYSSPELQRLESILVKQYEMFDFRFNWKEWEENRETYLLSLGIDSDLVQIEIKKKSMTCDLDFTDAE